MFVKVLRWTIGLPLLAGGLGAFVVGVFTSPTLVVLALIVCAVGLCLVVPQHLTGASAGVVDDSNEQALREANPELVGTGAWYARRAADQCPTATEVWYQNQLTR